MNITPTTPSLTSASLSGSLANQGKSELAANIKRSEISQGPAGTEAETPLQAIKASQESQAASKEKLEEAASQIQDFVGSINNVIKFSVEEETGGSLMVKVVDHQTEEVIRQIPSEEAIRIAKTLDQLKGLLLYNKA